MNQINFEPAMPEPTPDLLGLRNDKENVMENIFDSTQDIREWKLENVLKTQELFRPPNKSYSSIDFTLT